MDSARVLERRPWLPALTGRRPAEYLAWAWLGLLVGTAVVSPLVLGLEPEQTSLDALAGPSSSHLFGTDDIGRDVFARVADAAGRSLLVGVLSVGLGLAVGLPFGALAALRPRIAGETIMRLADVLLAFPAIILALVIGLMVGKGFWSVVLVIGIVLVPQFVRLVRARLATELTKEYVLAERATGASLVRILGYHVSRNVAPPLVAFAILAMADAMVFEAALSFIGVGIQPPDPSWGNMLLDGQKVLFAGAWWVSVFPGLALFLTVLAINSVVERRLDRVGGVTRRVRA